MAFWGISRLTRRPAFAVVARYGLAVASVATALGTTLILRHYNFPAHFISHFTLIAIAITFWRAGTRSRSARLLTFFFGGEHFGEEPFPFADFQFGTLSSSFTRSPAVDGQV